jgi:serine/threonine protein kinase
MAAATVCRPFKRGEEIGLLNEYAKIGYTGVKNGGDERSGDERSSGEHVGGKRKQTQRRLRQQRRQKQSRNQRGGGYESWFTDGLTDEIIAGAGTIKELGRGTYGLVSLLRTADGREIVEKCIQVVGVPGQDSCKLLRLVRNEAAILKELSENPAVLPYIIPCIGYKLPGAAVTASSAVNYPSEKYAYLYFPYIVGKDAIDYFNNIYSESSAQQRMLLSQVVYNNLLNHVLAGLKAIHAAGFIHRDIKLENIYVDMHDPENIRFFIIDFGLSIRNTGKLATIGGTIGYLHPDLKAAFAAGSAIYKPEYDLYALNVCIHKIFDLFDNLSKWLAAHAAAAPAAAAPAAAAVQGQKRQRSNNTPDVAPHPAPKKNNATKRRRPANAPRLVRQETGINNGPNANNVAAAAAANYAFRPEIVNAYFRAQQKNGK